MEYYSTLGKKEILPFIDNMNEAWGHYGSKINQTKTKSSC